MSEFVECNQSVSDVFRANFCAHKRREIDGTSGELRNKLPRGLLRIFGKFDKIIHEYMLWKQAGGRILA